MPFSNSYINDNNLQILNLMKTTNILHTYNCEYFILFVCALEMFMNLIFCMWIFLSIYMKSNTCLCALKMYLCFESYMYINPPKHLWILLCAFIHFETVLAPCKMYKAFKRNNVSSLLLPVMKSDRGSLFIHSRLRTAWLKAKGHLRPAGERSPLCS